MKRILVVDDDAVSCQLLADVLRSDGAEVVTETDGGSALELAERLHVDLALVDVRMPGMTGISLLTELRRRFPSLPVILMTAFGSVETAVEAVGAGAADYLSKPADVHEIRAAVARALGHPSDARAELPSSEADVGGLVGRSAAMVRIYNTIARVASGRSTVLVLGESGTGKELIARAIHRHGPRSRGPYVAVDCGALPETLLESELFGHVRGAFTGAIADSPGLFAEADGGTLFLDEIGHVSPELQSRLLRALQEHEIRPVGGQKWRTVDARVIAATNRNLAAEVAAGRFREDLFYRLKVVTIEVPPLRERPEDLPLLVDHLIRRAARDGGRPAPGISRSALRAIEAYPWPGNVRELAHALERAVVLARDEMISEHDLPEPLSSMRSGPPPAIPRDRPTLGELKRRYVQMVVAEQGGNITRAAGVLGVDRRSLYRILERYAQGARDVEDEDD
ncbi:MAG: sigma-54-dependent Fis family transcriptional regulator [Deltaproteobacteria bacterium]|nr:sigma-54-dependent Fis family transcriptional regulator [Deltaproteobacteria bacterium]